MGPDRPPSADPYGPGVVVVPARNEAPRIEGVLAQLGRLKSSHGLDFRVLVVENGSSDPTASVAHRAGADVLCSAPGYAHALKTGFHAALQHKPAWVAQLDADGQHLPSMLLPLLDALPRADLVIGTRFPHYPGYRVSLPRKLAIRGLSAWTSFLTGQRLYDVTSGLRVWSPYALSRMVQDYPTDIADANLLVRALKRGIRILEVPVQMQARPSGRSMHRGPQSVVFAARMAGLVVYEALVG